MSNCAIICEFNPLHNGHQRLLDAARTLAGEDGTVVCLMSGNFVQRGEPALLHKLDRAAAALAAGADVVLELPLTAAVASAERFAGEGVRILAALGGVDWLCFGSECGDAARLTAAARALQSAAFPAALRRQLDGGLPFAAARQAALETLTGDGALLAGPNDILAVEYCKALAGTNIQAWTLRREGAYHGGSDPAQPSASWLRRSDTPEAWVERVPPAALTIQRRAARYGYTYGQRAVLARLRTLTDAQWEALPYGGEGLWRRLMAAARSADSLEAALETAATRRYPRARLRRMLLCAYLGLTAEELSAPAPWVRLLGFSPAGQPLLRQWRGGALPVLHVGTAGPDAAFDALERRAAALYGLLAEDLSAARHDERACRVVRG